MRFKNFDLIAMILVVAINVGWTQVPNRPIVISVILAAPFVFIVPGYALTTVLFHRRSQDAASNLILPPSLKIGQPVNAVDHIILSLGLSLTMDVLIGFMLNVFSIRLQALSWTISLGLVTTICTLLALYFRLRDHTRIERMPRPRITIYNGILFGLAILIVALALWLSVIRPLATQSGFTQFWVLPSNQTSNSCAVRIGMQNFEGTSVTYRITMTVNGVQVNTWPSVMLAHGQEWNQFVQIPSESTNSIYVEARLYKLDKPDTVYRDAHLTLNSSQGSTNQKMHC